VGIRRAATVKVAGNRESSGGSRFFIEYDSR